LIRLSEYVLNVIARRDLGRLPDPSHPPNVLMKLDIEGAEVEVFPDLLITGAIAKINSSMIEWHDHITGPQERRDLMLDLARGAKAVANVTAAFHLVDMEDETYYDAWFPAPSCGHPGNVEDFALAVPLTTKAA